MFRLKKNKSKKCGGDSPTHVCRCAARLRALGIVLDKQGNVIVQANSASEQSTCVSVNNQRNNNHCHNQCYWNTGFDQTEKHEFNMEMTCEGCSNAAIRVLNKIGVTDVKPDLDKQKVFVVSEQSADTLLEALKKTGKKVEYVGVV